MSRPVTRPRRGWRRRMGWVLLMMPASVAGLLALGLYNATRDPVAAGLGTSVLPLRFGAPPDVWLVTLRGRP